MLEKMTEKTASMPSQNAPVVTAHGYNRRQEIRPAGKNHIVNHQKPMNGPGGEISGDGAQAGDRR